MQMRVLSMIPVLSTMAMLSMIQPLLAVEQLGARKVLDAISTPPIFQNPFMGPNNFSEIHLNSFQTDTTSTRGPASASSQAVQQGLLRPITSHCFGGQIFTFDIQCLRYSPGVRLLRLDYLC